jgi:PIN domain nuclease of toxin-antitoxin system
MKILLDSHTFFWWTIDHPKLSHGAHAATEDPDNEVFVSAVAAWEMATKVRLGKWNDAKPIVASFDEIVTRSGFMPLPISVRHARTAALLTCSHGDPFDRILAAQSKLGDVPLVTADEIFKVLRTHVIW